MTGFLREIVEAVRADIARSDYREGLPTDPPRRPPSLRHAIEAAPSGWALMVERKHRSPGSAQPDLPTRSLDEFARLVGSCGADAVSCLATRPAFDGSPREVADLAEHLLVPVLFKDFLVDPVQIDAARRSGASAVLLIARLETAGLLRLPLADLAAQAHRAGLEVLLEFHAKEEVKLAATVPADGYGVNVRDLDTLTFRPDVARATFEALAGHTPRIGLSGVEGPQEARRFRTWGADGILVGSAFARATDPAAFFSALRAVASTEEKA